MSFTAIGYLAGRLWPYALAAALLFCAIAWYGSTREDEGFAKGHAAGVELEAKAANAALDSERTERAIEQRRSAAQRKINDELEAKLQQNRADAAIAAAAAGRLRQRVAALVASARAGQGSSDPTAARGGSAAEDAIGMFADVLGRCESDYRRMAAIADDRGERGAGCERIYDSLTERTAP